MEACFMTSRATDLFVVTSLVINSRPALAVWTASSVSAERDATVVEGRDACGLSIAEAKIGEENGRLANVHATASLWMRLRGPACVVESFSGCTCSKRLSNLGITWPVLVLFAFTLRFCIIMVATECECA